jgi:hypothetical protein
MSASIHPDSPLAEILIRNVNELTDDERETIAHMMRYQAAHLTMDADFPTNQDGDYSLKILDISMEGDGD